MLKLSTVFVICDEWSLGFLCILSLVISAARFDCFLQFFTARKPLIFKAFRASLTLVPAGYIGARYSALGGDLPLGSGWLVIQAVSHGDNHTLPLVQAARHAGAHLDAGIPCIQLLQHIVIHADHIHQGEGVSIGIRINGIRQRHLRRQLFP